MRKVGTAAACWLLLMAIAADEARAQTSGRRDDGSGLPRAASLGLPQAGDSEIRQTGFWDSPFSSRSDSSRIDSTSRRYDEFPPPSTYGAELPLPTSARGGRGGKSSDPYHVTRPFTIDYVFLARSPVDGPANALTMNEIGVNYQFKFPVGQKLQMTVRPLFDVTFLAGPDGPYPTLPPELYKLAVDLQADIQVNNTMGLSFGITPGFWSDFKQFGSEDFRIPVRLLGTFKVSDDLFLAAGVEYTDNFYHNLYPAGGVIWKASDQVQLELLWPRSRIVYRMREQLQFYSVFERGGDTYHIHEVGDEMTQYRDWRVMVGTQLDLHERFAIFAEVGAAFDRLWRFDYQPQTGVGNSLVLRTGIRF